MQRKKAVQIVDTLRQHYPEAGPRLHFNSPYELLVAVILSAQSTDQQVNEVTPALFAIYPDFASMAVAGLEALETAICGVGLYKNKARYIRQCAQVIIEQHEGQVPGDFEELLKLPGIGRKSANVIFSVAFGKPGLAVDTHVFRVTGRMGMAGEKDPDKTELVLKRLLPAEIWTETHHLLIFHGRALCTARSPKCSDCPVESLCEKHLDFQHRRSRV